MRSDSNAAGSGGASSHTGSANAAEHATVPRRAAAPVRRSSGGSRGAAAPVRRASSGGSYGAPSAETRRIQQALHIPADGIMGPQTRAAIITYQRTHGLVADGIVGPLTSAKLFGGGGGSSGGGGRAPLAHNGTASAKPALDLTKLASEYGWSMSVLNSNAELKAKFQQAVANGWTQAEFIAQVQNTKWYRTQGESMRQNLILQKADPATWTQRLNTKVADIVAAARQYGATLNSAQAKNFATDAMMFGWDTQQVQQHLAGYVSYSNNPKSPLQGQAGQAVIDYKRILGDYGVTVSDGTMNQWLRDTISGTKDSSWVTNYARGVAKSTYPALAQRLDAGETLSTIAEPYKQSYGKILETDPNAINLSDPLIKQALAGKDSQGQPAVQPVWDFENKLRADPRWLKTQNAQDQVMSSARQVLSDFGFQH